MPNPSLLCSCPADRLGGTARLLLVLLRVAVGWVFLWASIHHFGDHAYIGAFLRGTATFHAVYAPLARPGLLPFVYVAVEYGQIAVALSLLTGFCFRLGAVAGIVTLAAYWTANMQFPFIESVDNLLVDEHVVYALVLALLISLRAGSVFGLQGWLSGRLGR